MAYPPSGRMPTGYPKLRSACDSCHQMKVRCSGDVPCIGCSNSGSLCYYSVSNRLGRPKGTKNKRTAASHGNTNERASPEQPRPAENWMSSNNDPPQVSPVTSQQSLQGNVFAGDQFGDIMDHAFDGDSILDTIMAETRKESLNSTTMSSLDTSSSHEYSGWVAMNGRTPRFRGLFDKDLYNAQGFEDIVPVSDSNPPAYMSTLIKNGTSIISQSNNKKLKSTNISPESSSNNTTPSTPPSTNCTCLQQHALLVCNLKGSEALSKNGSEDSSLSIDNVLSGVQEAQNLWDQLINCQNCSYNDDQEVLLLAVMSIRAVLRNWQALQPKFKMAAQKSSYSDNPSTTGNSRAQTPNSDQRFFEERLSIGSFEITGDDRALLLRCLLLNTLSKIKSTVRSLKEILERKMKKILGTHLPSPISNRGSDIDSMMAEQSQSSSNLYYIRQMLQGFTSSLQLLEDGLKARNEQSL